MISVIRSRSDTLSRDRKGRENNRPKNVEAMTSRSLRKRIQKLAAGRLIIIVFIVTIV